MEKVRDEESEESSEGKSSLARKSEGTFLVELNNRKENKRTSLWPTHSLLNCQ